MEKIAVVGCNGRMGCLIKAALENKPLTSLNLIGKATIKQLLRPTIFSYWGNFDDCDDQINGLKETALNEFVMSFSLKCLKYGIK